MTLHGYVNFTGAPINESGNTDYNLLKSIENGASLYYVLSYRNSTLMKQDGRWSKYYSIRFDIWFDEMIKQYKEVNAAIGDLQTSLITDHEFLIGERVPDAKEILENEELLSQAIYEAVAKAMDKAKDDKLGEYRQRLELYQKLKEHDKKLKGLNATQRAEYLETEFAELTEEKRAEVAKAYAAGKDYKSFEMKTGLKVGVLPDLEKLYASIEAFTGKALTEEQKDEIYFIIAEKITVFDVEEKLLSIINDGRIKSEKISLTKDKLYKIDRLIVDGATEKEMKAVLAGIINEDIMEELRVDEATVAKIAEALSDCIFHGDEDVYAENVEIIYDFNKTNSEATDRKNYVSTAYTLDDERLVMVTYSDAYKGGEEVNEVRFILNYNIFSVKVTLDGTTYEIPSYGYVRIEK
jgi:hypothetical protein